VIIGGGDPFINAQPHPVGILFRGDLRAVGALEISRNVIVGVAGDGIEVVGSEQGTPQITISGGPVTIAHNLVAFNRGHGIDAPWMPGVPTGIVDGGHNLAIANGLRPACIGVRC
jgi:hypothetical protein